MKLYTSELHSNRILVQDHTPGLPYREYLFFPKSKFGWGGYTLDCLVTASFLLGNTPGIKDRSELQHDFMCEVVAKFSIRHGFSIWDWQIEEWVKSKVEASR